jgi:TnsA endonuclease N terminal
MKYSQGIYTPKNLHKYAGKGNIRYRSSWELAFMNFCDNHPSILHWASESISIPYYNPIKNKNVSYVPDFFVVYQDAKGQRRAELIEIKPSKETTVESAGRSLNNQVKAAINQAKWAAARRWCENQKISFRVITEHDMFNNTSKKKR